MVMTRDDRAGGAGVESLETGSWRELAGVGWDLGYRRRTRRRTLDPPSLLGPETVGCRPRVHQVCSGVPEVVFRLGVCSSVCLSSRSEILLDGSSVFLEIASGGSGSWLGSGLAMAWGLGQPPGFSIWPVKMEGRVLRVKDFPGGVCLLEDGRAAHV
jgi:hypothetical protein